MSSGNHAFHISVLSLMLIRGNYYSIKDYRLDEYAADLYVQRPFEQPFIVQIIPEGAEGNSLMPSEDDREMLAKAFCAPVFFARVQKAGRGGNRLDEVQLEEFLLSKVVYSDDDIVVKELRLAGHL
jgi:hypothetical protein